MKSRILILLALTGFLASCGAVRDSRLNPLNWFGKARETRVEAVPAAELGDPRALIDQVASLAVDRSAGGAIVRAVGLPPTQGYWEGELVALNGGLPVKGVLSFEFRAFPPPVATRVSTQQSREVLVGLFLSNQSLEGVRTIEVIGARNRRSVRR